MSLSSGAAIYFIMWWLVFFAVLPWGIRSQSEHGEFEPGTDPGAPAVHRLGVKLVWTTLVSGIIFGVFYWAYATKAVAFEDLATLWGLIKP